MNMPLLAAIFSIASTVLIGVIMIVLIVLEKSNLQTMIGAVVAGVVISIPIAIAVTKKLSTLGKSQESA